jgi:archaemetzincin
MPGLELMEIGLPGRRWLLERLSARLHQTFRVAVSISKSRFESELCYDASRGQYNSTQMLKRLLSTASPNVRILGVTGVDLFIPVLTYVFGEAQVDGRAAVVSTHRLRNEAYGLPRDDELMAGRLEKEAIHELGHTFGLLHCSDSRCVMHSSTYVEEIDLKTADFCDACGLVVRKTGSDVQPPGVG